MFGAAQPSAAPVQQIVPQVQPQTAISSWMADVQTNPYGNLKIKPSAHEPTLFSADPHLSTPKTLADDSGPKNEKMPRMSIL